MESLVSRLEAVTARLEDVTARREGGVAHSTTGSAGSSATNINTVTPAMAAFDAVLAGHFAEFVACSQKLGGDIAAQVRINRYQ